VTYDILFKNLKELTVRANIFVTFRIDDFHYVFIMVPE